MNYKQPVGICLEKMVPDHMIAVLTSEQGVLMSSVYPV